MPSRFSSLRQSEVKNSPADSPAARHSQVSTENSTLPSPHDRVPCAMLSTMQPLPMTSAVNAAAIRSQNVLRFRAATRSSRFTIGSQFTARG